MSSASLHPQHPTLATMTIMVHDDHGGRRRMKYLGKLGTDPTLWLLFLMIGGAGSALLYVVLTSITF
ncbi:hypothetical protein [Nitratireductor rhodophyticola]|uniref:hypothetical protein n=1 Tax=Nitratireductor rhodophyticola TaxID=2854036 RepID=UPI003007FA69